MTSIFVYIFSFIALMCSKGLRHKTPMNYVMLFIFTISMAFMVAGITAYLQPMSVLLAIGILALILGCLWMSVMLTTDMAKAARSVCLAILAAVMIQLIIFIPMLFTSDFDGLWILYCTLGIIVSAGLIYLDVFIIMLAGKYAMDEYIYCALLLYIDIIRLLLYLLMLFGKGK